MYLQLTNLAAHNDPSLVQPSPDALESAGMLSMGTTTATAMLQHHGVIHQTSATLWGGGGGGGREGERE